MMAFDASSFLRHAIYEVEEYTPSLSLDSLSELLLDSNENPYGPSPKVKQALATYGYYHLYPDSRQNRLREAIQAYIGVDKAHIMLGNGSDELIDLVMRLFLGPGDAVILCLPSFGMYGFYATLNGARVMDVLRRADFSLDIEGVEQAAKGGAKLLFLASPHNPSGCLTPRRDILRLLELPLVIVVDEAYAEFSGESVVDLVPEHPNLIVLRTFSKWAGLAGLRVGYGIFPLDIIKHLWRIKPPDNINAAGQVAALASLDDLEYLRGNVRRIVAERERLYKGLEAIPYLRPYPSQANFILCRVVGKDVRALREALEREGIVLRYFKEPGLQDFVRITVGKPEHTDTLLAVLHKTCTPRRD
jgi:histidinol-phosphate aminotransferase